MTRHLGFPIPSPEILERVGLRFRKAVAEFAVYGGMLGPDIKGAGMATREGSGRLASYERQYRDLLDQLSSIGFVMAGSLAARYNRCGTPTCRCHRDPLQLHGPYWQWTAKINGKIVNRRLTEHEAELHWEWIANDRLLRATIDELRRVAANATKLIITETTDPDQRF